MNVECSDKKMVGGIDFKLIKDQYSNSFYAYSYCKRLWSHRTYIFTVKRLTSFKRAMRLNECENFKENKLFL